MLNMLVVTRMPRPATGGGSHTSQWGYISNVYVQPAHRDRGVGGRLLDAATTYADEHALARVVLSPSERSIPFYRRRGFGPATGLMVRPGPE